MLLDEAAAEVSRAPVTAKATSGVPLVPLGNPTDQQSHGTMANGAGDGSTPIVIQWFVLPSPSNRHNNTEGLYCVRTFLWAWPAGLT